MSKHIKAFLDAPNSKTATSLIRYINKHPFALCGVNDAILDKALNLSTIELI